MSQQKTVTMTDVQVSVKPVKKRSLKTKIILAFVMIRHMNKLMGQGHLNYLSNSKTVYLQYIYQIELKNLLTMLFQEKDL